MTSETPFPRHELAWAGERLFPLAERALWWPRRSTLMVADVHFGKIGHFRRAGIALPKAPFDLALRRLGALADRLDAGRLLVLGDLFHSDWNAELEFFGRWRSRRPGLAVELVRGNHDVLDEAVYGGLGVLDRGPRHREARFEFVHDPEEGEEGEEDGPEGFWRIAGHVHPGVRLLGKARQSLRLPCFWFTGRLGLLPAFGDFTGSAIVRPAEGDRVFAVAGESVLEWDPATGRPVAQLSRGSSG